MNQLLTLSPRSGASLPEPQQRLTRRHWPHTGAVVLVMALFANPAARAQTVDTLVMGDTASESSHQMTAAFPPVVTVKDDQAPPASDPSDGPPSDVVTGGLKQTARRLLPRTPNGDMYGGELDFTMKVDPVNQNYFTIKLWGSDTCPDGALILNCEGYEIGRRHGNSSADMLVHAGGAWFPGRFWYRTATLPLKLTKGKESVAIKIRSSGKIYDYSGPHAPYIPKYQHLMQAPSWPVYAVYTHVGGYLDMSNEVQGDPPEAKPRTEPGPEVIDLWKTVVSNKAAGLIKATSMRIPDIEYLAQCYGVSWTPAYQQPAAVDAVVRGIDEIVKAYAADNNDSANQNKYHNSAWGGAYGPMGVAISLLYPQMKDRMGETVDFGGTLGSVTRKEGWSKALRSSVDFGRCNRRSISNQEIDCSEQIYSANKGLLLIDADNALPEAEALRYPYEAAGLSPFLGNDEPGTGPMPVRGSDTPDNKLWFGPNWYCDTTRGTTKEPSFVGSDYGEVAPQIYRLGRLANDRKLMDRGLEMIRARGHFRFPGFDAQGYPIMTATEPIGARNNYLPGHDAYISREICADVVAHEDVPDLTGWFQELLADGQLYSMLAGGASVASSTGLSTDPAQLQKAVSGRAGSPGAPYVPDDLALALAKPASKIRMPTAPNAPDFAWGDEENMVVAANHGDELFFTNMVWRGNLSINKVANIFLVTSHIATRAEVQLDDIRYVSTGMYETGGGSVDSFSNRNPPDNKTYPNVDQGVQWPIALRPDLSAPPPRTNNDGGRGTGYTLCYGHWLVGLNGNYTTGDYTMKLPPGFTSGTDLVSGREIKAPVVIPKGTTVVFYLPRPTAIPTSPDTTPDAPSETTPDPDAPPAPGK